MNKSVLISVLVTALLSPPLTAENSLALDYLNNKIDDYENSLQKCMLMGSSAGLPGAAVIAALKAYPQQDTESFLLTRATLADEKCASPALGELAVALFLVEADNEPVSEDVALLIGEIKPAVFSSTRWELQHHYLSLPQEMRTQLEAFDTFQQPFNSLLIRQHLFSSADADADADAPQSFP